jgi:hypothetical protein
MSVRVRAALSATAAARRAVSTAHPRPITSATVTGEKRVHGQVQPVRLSVRQPRRLNLLSCRRQQAAATNAAAGERIPGAELSRVDTCHDPSRGAVDICHGELVSLRTTRPGLQRDTLL